MGEMIGKQVKVLPANLQDWEKERREIAQRTSYFGARRMMEQQGVRPGEMMAWNRVNQQQIVYDEAREAVVAQAFWDEEAKKVAKASGVVVVIGYTEGPDNTDSGVGHEMALALKLGVPTIWVDRDGVSGAKYLQG